MIRRGLILLSAVLSGETIFSESPMVSTLYPEVEVIYPSSYFIA
jgi:hypothetical protein